MAQWTRSAPKTVNGFALSLIARAYVRACVCLPNLWRPLDSLPVPSAIVCLGALPAHTRRTR